MVILYRVKCLILFSNAWCQIPVIGRESSAGTNLPRRRTDSANGKACMLFLIFDGEIWKPIQLVEV